MPAKPLLLPLALVLGASLACHDRPGSATPGETTLALTSATETRGEGVAVIELFTSEGCSSCPSADAVLGEVVRNHDARVFPLAFHVDYWNSLGWQDRFSSPAWSDRQRQYAEAFSTSSVYTPQMIVGGVDPFTGSDASHAATSVARSLATGSATRIAVTAESTGPRDVLVHFRTEAAPAGALVNIALVERGLVTRVRSGENSGKTLPHENVVRAFASHPLTAPEGTVGLDVPTDVDRSHAEVFGYVQTGPRSAQRGMPIVAAARTAAPVAR